MTDDLYKRTAHQALMNRISRKVDEIAQICKGSVEVTVIIRDTKQPDGRGDLFVSSELDPRTAVAALDRLTARKQYG